MLEVSGNLKETYKTTFVDDMVTYIKANKIKVFRPHDSGDFYDGDYVKKWAKIAKQCPKVVFFGYTKSLELNLEPLTRLPNFGEYCCPEIRSSGKKTEKYCAYNCSLPRA